MNWDTQQFFSGAVSPGLKGCLETNPNMICCIWFQKLKVDKISMTLGSLFLKQLEMVEVEQTHAGKVWKDYLLLVLPFTSQWNTSIWWRQADRHCNPTRSSAFLLDCPPRIRLKMLHHLFFSFFSSGLCSVFSFFSIDSYKVEACVQLSCNLICKRSQERISSKKFLE